MFEYVPGNYTWNLAVLMSLNMGGVLSEIDTDCAELKQYDSAMAPGAAAAWARCWTRLGDRLVTMAEADDPVLSDRTRGKFHRRAAAYYLTAEHMMDGHGEDRRAVYLKGLSQFRRSVEMMAERVEQVEIPFEGAAFPALFVPAPRAAAFEPRLKCCICLGAAYDFGQRIGWHIAKTHTAPSVTNALGHISWVFGVEGEDALRALGQAMTLDGVLHRIRCPLLVLHGENDRQIPTVDAHRTVAEAVDSPEARLRIFTAAEGGVEHCQADNPSLAMDYIADWAARVL